MAPKKKTAKKIAKKKQKPEPALAAEMARIEAEVLKFRLYEATVQSPRWQVDYLPQFHEWLTGRAPLTMREDFCGTGRISCEWVKKSPKHRAVGLDLDPETLAYADTFNRSRVGAAENKRLSFLLQDVLVPTREKFDTVGAYNFSFFIFHERQMMLKYVRAVLKSLKSKGTFFLELAGGEGFLDRMTEDKVVRVPGIGKIKQVWEQHDFDPISCVSDYSIHFRLPNGTWMNDAFTYHWRIWGIRELRDILHEAGFKKTVVLWETANRKGNGTGEYLPSETGDHAHAWVAYVVGVK